jgi:hypothetical protein
MSVELDSFFYENGEDIDVMLMSAATPADFRRAVQEYQRLRRMHELDWREQRNTEKATATP